MRLFTLHVCVCVCGKVASKRRISENSAPSPRLLTFVVGASRPRQRTTDANAIAMSANAPISLLQPRFACLSAFVVAFHSLSDRCCLTLTWTWSWTWTWTCTSTLTLMLVHRRIFTTFFHSLPAHFSFAARLLACCVCHLHMYVCVRVGIYPTASTTPLFLAFATHAVHQRSLIDHWTWCWPTLCGETNRHVDHVLYSFLCTYIYVCVRI